MNVRIVKLRPALFMWYNKPNWEISLLPVSQGMEKSAAVMRKLHSWALMPCLVTREAEKAIAAR